MEDNENTMNNLDSKTEDSHTHVNDDKSVSTLKDLKQDDHLSKAAKDVLDELEPKETLFNGGCLNVLISYYIFLYNKLVLQRKV